MARGGQGASETSICILACRGTPMYTVLAARRRGSLVPARRRACIYVADRYQSHGEHSGSLYIYIHIYVYIYIYICVCVCVYIYIYILDVDDVDSVYFISLRFGISLLRKQTTNNCDKTRERESGSRRYSLGRSTWLNHKS